MQLKKLALLALIAVVIVSSGCSQEKNQLQPAPTQTPTPQTPSPTPNPTTSTPSPIPSPITPTLTPTPKPIPKETPLPTPTPETVVIDGNKQNWDDLSPEESKAMNISLKEKSFKLFCKLPEIFYNYTAGSLLWQEKYRGCSKRKREALEEFVNGIRVTITRLDENIYEVKATHPLIYKGERFERQRAGKTITVDTGSEKIVNSLFYQPYNGLLLHSVFTAEDQLLLGFSEYQFGIQDYKTMSDRFAEKFCMLSDEDFR